MVAPFSNFMAKLGFCEKYTKEFDNVHWDQGFGIYNAEDLLHLCSH